MPHPMASSLCHPAFSRRVALQAGALGLLGLGVHHLSAFRASAAGRHRPKAKAVIYIFLSGGLAQQDSFDLKPDAPDTFRGEFKPIATRTPGLRICEHLPLLSERCAKWALCRSLTHPSNDHSASHHIMMTGRSDLPPGFDPNRPRPGDWPSLAAVASQLLRPSGNLPPAVVLPEPLIHRTGRVIPGQFAGQLGSRFDPFLIAASPYNAISYGAYPEYGFHHETGADKRPLAFQAPSLTLPHELTRDRLGDRLGLLASLDRQQKRLEQSAEAAGFDRHRARAVALLADPAVKHAFDVTRAEPRVQDRYGRNQFGWSLLMAKRLVEAGVSLVQVNLGNNETWDTHQAAFPNLKNFLLPPTDRAVAALLDDLSESGLLDSTLLVMAGEFGRTPRIFSIPGAKLPGRDHWGRVQTVFLAGGGTPGGAVVGASDKIGGHPAHDARTPEDLAATIYHALGLPANAAWRDPANRPHFLYQGKPFFNS